MRVCAHTCTWPFPQTPALRRRTGRNSRALSALSLLHVRGRRGCVVGEGALEAGGGAFSALQTPEVHGHLLQAHSQCAL